MAPVAAMPPNEWCRDVGEALADQLLVRVVPGAGHAVGDDGGQQRLDGAQHGDGEGGRQQGDQPVHADRWQHEARQAHGDFAECAADGGDGREGEHGLDRRRGHQRDHRPRHPAQPRHARAEHDEQQAGQCQRGRDRVQLRQDLQQMPELVVEVCAASFGQAEEVVPLADPDDHADAGREADDDRGGDEADHPAEPGQPKRRQHDAGHDGREQQPVHAERRHDPGQDDDERAGRPGDLHPAAAERRDDQAGDDGGVDALLGPHAGRDGEGQRQGQGDDPDNEPGDNVRRPLPLSEQAGP